MIRRFKNKKSNGQGSSSQNLLRFLFSRVVVVEEVSLTERELKKEMIRWKGEKTIQSGEH